MGRHGSKLPQPPQEPKHETRQEITTEESSNANGTEASEVPLCDSASTGSSNGACCAHCAQPFSPRFLKAHERKCLLRTNDGNVQGPPRPNQS